jgi:hypothetical protein
LLERAFPKLPESIREVRVRADAAFFDHEIVRLIEGKSALYAIVARLTRPLQSRLWGLRYHRISSGVWAGEFRYCPHLQRATLQRLRPRLFVVPAQLVRPAGAPTLRLPENHPGVRDFLETQKRIRHLRAPF